MGASAGAIGRFNVVKGAEKREPAFGAKCGQRDLFGRLRLVSYVAAGVCCCAVSTDLQHGRSSSAVACNAVYC